MEVTGPFRPPRALPPLFLAFALAAAYSVSLAPDLTWANDGADGGDLIAAAATRGVAHPTGYPLYLILARLFLSLPLGPPAWRTNLMSAVFAVGAALLVYWIVRRETGRWMAALPAGASAGLAPLLWSQAVITEVYALHAFLVALIILLSTGPRSEHGRRFMDGLRGLVLGLALGNHLTILLLLPVVLFVNSSRSQETGRRRRLDWGAFARQGIFFSFGTLIYLFLPAWAGARPPVNWGNAVTPGRLWWLLSAQLYQDQLLSVPLMEAWQRLGAWAALLLRQFGLLGLLLGAASLFFFQPRSRLFQVTLWTFVVYSLFAVGFGTFDSYVYLIPALLAFSVWIGMGAAGLLDAITPDSPGLAFLAGIGMVVFFGWLGMVHLPQVDAARDARAVQFGREVLAAAPPQAIVFAEGDRAVFSLWYFHYALRERPDMSVIAVDLLLFDWYQETLQTVYPALHLPDLRTPAALSAANPGLPVCLVSYLDGASIECHAYARSGRDRPGLDVPAFRTTFFETGVTP